jgi:hypothetical protein
MIATTAASRKTTLMTLLEAVALISIALVTVALIASATVALFLIASTWERMILIAVAVLVAGRRTWLVSLILLTCLVGYLRLQDSHRMLHVLNLGL